jgi:alpha-tubulin suppressor-like RCC1 family protein
MRFSEVKNKISSQLNARGGNMRSFRLFRKSCKFFLCVSLLMLSKAVEACECPVQDFDTVLVRNSGTPTTQAVQFNVKNTNAKFTLKLLNGPKGHFRVSAATVTLNDQQVFGPRDFNQKTVLLEKTVKVSASNTLQVQLLGRPGSAIELWGCQEDKVKPYIAVTQPARGSTIMQKRPIIIVNYSDAQSGINLRTLSIKVNGTDRTKRFIKTAAQATWQSTPLPEGRNTVIARIADKAGNYASDTCVFTVQTHPVVTLTITSPSKDTVVNNTPIAVTYAVNGVSHTRSVNLVEGINTVIIDTVICFRRLADTVMVTLVSPEPYEETLSSEIFIKPVTVENKNGTAVFSGAYVYGKTGQPSMPYYKVWVLLPPNADLDSVTVNLINPQEQLVSGVFAVKPAIPPYDTNARPIWPQGVNPLSGKDVVVYGTNAYFPASFVSKVTAGKMRQYKMVEVVITPYQYNPVTGALRMITGGLLSVSAKQQVGDSVKNIPRSAWAENKFIDNIANPEVLSAYEPISSVNFQGRILLQGALGMSAAASGLASGTGYAIVTTVDITTNPCAKSILDFIGSLEAKGVVVSKLFLDPKFLSPASARADSIRNWLQLNYMRSDSGFQYALLIGDPHPDSGTIPMKDYFGIPTDFYYSELDGNWYNRGPDGNWGDVVVGRIPADISSCSVLITSYLSNVMNYENDANTGWRRLAMLPMVPLGFGTEFGPESWSLGEHIKDNILIPAQWDYYRLYDVYNFHEGAIDQNVANMSPLAEDISCSYNDVVAMWNAYNPGLVVWLTHGQPYNAVNVLNNQITDSLKIRYPAMVFESSCSNGDPRAPGNLPELLLGRKAISAIAATVSVGEASVLASEYASRLIANKPTGDAFFEAKDKVYDASLGFNLFGCPHVALNVYTVDIANSPSRPEDLRATAVSSSGIDISWTAANNATSYIIERGVDTATKEGGFAVLASVSGQSTTTYSDLGLPSETKYKYRVRAVNGTYLSWYSNIDSSTTWNAATGTLIPEIPTGIVAQAGDHFVLIDGTSALRATAYNIKRSVSSGGPYVTIATVTYARPWYPCYNLINGTTYYFVVSAVNQWGESGNSSEVSATPVAASVVPTPEHFRDTLLTPTSVTLLWDYLGSLGTTTDNTGTTVGVEVERKTRDLFTNVFNNWEKIKKVPYYGNWYNTVYYGQPLENNTDYMFRIRGYGDPGHYSGYSNEVSITTPKGNAPAVPDSFDGTPLMPEIIHLSWKDTSTGALTPKATSFQIFWKNNSGTFSRDFVVNTPDTFYDFHTSANSIIHFGIRSVYTEPGKDPLYSLLSSVLTVTTPGWPISAPFDLSAKGLSLTSVLLSWQDTSGMDTGYVLERMVWNDTAWTIIDTVGAGVTTYANTGLVDTFTYYYRVKALCTPWPGFSAYSDVVAVTPALAVAPELSATALSVISVMLNWIDNSGGNAIGFNIERWADYDTSWTVLDTVAGNVINYPDNGLTDSISYRYRVQALFPSGGHSFYSNETSITIRRALAPSNLTAEIADSHSADLHWTDNSGSNDTGFVIERADGWWNYGQGIWDTVDTVGANVTSYRDAGLMMDSLYIYRVCALLVGGPGRSSYSNVVTIKIGVPSAPSLYVSPLTADAIHLGFSWNSMVKAVGYRVDRALDSAGPFVTIRAFPWGGASHRDAYIQDSSFTDSVLSPNAVYYYRASAYNILGEAYSDTVSIKTLPAAPQNLVAIQVSKTSATLSWSPGPNGAEGFKIRRATLDSTFFDSIAAVGPTDTVYVDTGLTPGTTYTYIVYALNASGGSEPSNTATVIMLTFTGPVKSVAGGYFHSLFVKTDGSLWACGDNSDVPSHDTPVHIMDSVQSVDARYGVSLVLKTDRTLWSFDNIWGDQQPPNLVQIMTGVQSAAVGRKDFSHYLILKTDSTLWTCGTNGRGQLGDGTTTDRSSPVQIMSGVKSIAAGSEYSLILKTDSTLWACGANDRGQLGDGTTTDRSSPVQIMSGVISIAAGFSHTLILKANDTLLGCGLNNAAQLGLGHTSDIYIPTQIMTEVKSMSAGGGFSHFLKTDGTLWGCGISNGRENPLGTCDIIGHVTPVEIMTDVQAVDDGDMHSILIKTDGNVWTTGANFWGNLGNGTHGDTRQSCFKQISF